MSDSVSPFVTPFLSRARFIQYFPELAPDQRTFPRKREAVLASLVSAMQRIEVRKAFSEWHINSMLQEWVDTFGAAMALDRVCVRRMLVNEGYLHRDRYGATYVLAAHSPSFGYDASIRDLDLKALVHELALQRAERKRALLLPAGLRRQARPPTRRTSLRAPAPSNEPENQRHLPAVGRARARRRHRRMACRCVRRAAPIGRRCIRAHAPVW